eukprot:ctg_769.g369
MAAANNVRDGVRHAPLRDPIPVAVLGATGSVGQRFVQLLEGHPWFRVVALGASQRSAGKRYAEQVAWKQATPIPSDMAGVEISECDPSLPAFRDVAVVFSGLDNQFAGDIETAFANHGKAVFSNAKNHRMDPDVPILIPSVNAEHIEAVRQQATFRSGGGFVVTNSNCSTAAMTIGLAPRRRLSGVERDGYSGQCGAVYRIRGGQDGERVAEDMGAVRGAARLRAGDADGVGDVQSSACVGRTHRGGIAAGARRRQTQQGGAGARSGGGHRGLSVDVARALWPAERAGARCGVQQRTRSAAAASGPQLGQRLHGDRRAGASVQRVGCEVGAVRPQYGDRGGWRQHPERGTGDGEGTGAGGA